MGNQIKMIVSDLDNTLLRTDKTLSEYTINILLQCRVKDIKIVYATARGRSAKLLVPTEIFDGEITMNGATVYAGGRIAHKHHIPYEIARPFLIAMDQYGLQVVSETSESHYSNFIANNKTVANFYQHDVNAEKIFIWSRNNGDIDYIKENLPSALYMQVCRKGMVMIMHNNASKSKAISELARIWDLAQKDIVAFGDDAHDIDMLTSVGISVAMGNALDEVKGVSDHICGPNNEDGVARWLATWLSL
jgi:hypothetical protein